NVARKNGKSSAAISSSFFARFFFSTHRSPRTAASHALYSSSLWQCVWTRMLSRSRRSWLPFLSRIQETSRRTVPCSSVTGQRRACIRSSVCIQNYTQEALHDRRRKCMFTPRQFSQLIAEKREYGRHE